jgi:hypothetical protein
MGWRVVELRFDYGQWRGSRETLGLKDPPVLWISGATSLVMRWMVGSGGWGVGGGDGQVHTLLQYSAERQGYS